MSILCIGRLKVYIQLDSSKDLTGILILPHSSQNLKRQFWLDIHFNSKPTMREIVDLLVKPHLYRCKKQALALCY